MHRALGPGFPEAVYQRALWVELTRARIPLESEKAVEVWYEGHICGEFRMDIVVDEKIVLELKALDELSDPHTAQALSYLKATRLHLALLLNLGAKSLAVRRVVL